MTKNIAIIGTSNDTKFGTNLTYVDYFSQFGDPFIIPPIQEWPNKVVTFFDVLVLPGGSDIDSKTYDQKPNFNSWDSDPFLEWGDKLIRYFINANRPIIGICRGHQAINVFYGGTLKQHLRNHSISEERDQLVHALWSDEKSISIIMDDNLDDDKEYKVNSMHHQAIDNLGQGLVPLAYSSDNEIEIITHQRNKILGFQYHPEEIFDPLSIKLVRGLLHV